MNKTKEENFHIWSNKQLPPSLVNGIVQNNIKTYTNNSYLTLHLRIHNNFIKRSINATPKGKQAEQFKKKNNCNEWFSSIRLLNDEETNQSKEACLFIHSFIHSYIHSKHGQHNKHYMKFHVIPLFDLPSHFKILCIVSFLCFLS